jgi:hypothetical protein
MTNQPLPPWSDGSRLVPPLITVCSSAVTTLPFRVLLAPLFSPLLLALYRSFEEPAPIDPRSTVTAVLACVAPCIPLLDRCPHFCHHSCLPCTALVKGRHPKTPVPLLQPSLRASRHVFLSWTVTYPRLLLSLVFPRNLDLNRWTITYPVFLWLSLLLVVCIASVNRLFAPMSSFLLSLLVSWIANGGPLHTPVFPCISSLLVDYIASNNRLFAPVSSPFM